MDMILYLILSIGISIFKIIKTGGTFMDLEVHVAQTHEHILNIPIGNNLMLKKDKYAFRFILYQLGVISK